MPSNDLAPRRTPSAGSKLTIGVCGGVIVLLAILAPGASPASSANQKTSAAFPVHISSATARTAVANSQLAFVAAPRGQARFAAHGPNYAVYFKRGEVVLAQVRRGRRGVAVGMRFLGMNPNAQPTADRPLGTKVSYLVGRSSDWQTGLATYGRVVYRDLWPGIDAAFTGRAGLLKYEFVVHPGADARAIRLAYEGAGRPRLSRAGDLLLPTRAGLLRDERPMAYQPLRRGHTAVVARYTIRSGPDGREVSFVVGRHAPNRLLVIDPAIAYSTYLGGSGFDGGLAIAVDTSGSAFVTWRTDSFDFPSIAGSFDGSNSGEGDAYVVKLSPSGHNLVYATFLGGSALDEGRNISVDVAGNAYVVGLTYSADFPTTMAALDREYGGNGDAFVAKLNPSGSGLVYSTYVGGSLNDKGFALAIDSEGVSYITGETDSPDYPTTGTSADPTWNGDFDAFVTAVDSRGTGIVYSTFLGGGGFDDGLAIAVDGARAAYVTGKASAGFPVTPGAFDVTQNGGYDSFVAKLDSTGSRLLYNTYLGGDAWDEGLGIKVDSSGDAYTTGNVQSANFPTTPGAFDTTFDGSVDAFVTKLNASGSGLVYSTFLGGSDWDEGDGLGIDSSGNAYVTGHLSSTDFPTTSEAFQRTPPGGVEAFLTILNLAGSSLVYSTYIGSPEWDGGLAMAVDSAGAAYIIGMTNSQRFPTTPGGFDGTANGDMDAFVMKIDSPSAQPPPPPPPSPTFTLSASPASQEVVRGNGTWFDITVNPQNGFNGAVALSVTGLPDATTASFAPNPATSSSVLTIQTTSTTPPGGYPLTITGTSGGITRTASVPLDVHCCPRPG